MKRTITLFTLLLFAGMMLPSCGLTIVKRQHTGGYYISTNSPKHAAKGEASIRTAEGREIAAASQEEEKQSEAEELAVAETSATTNKQEAAVDVPAIRTERNDAAPAESDKAGSDKASATDRMPLLSSMAEKMPMTKKMDSNVKKMKSKAASSRGGDGLSLIWIVILVLLILWALGFIGGWGTFINLLLVIALVLLILWLLRII